MENIKKMEISPLILTDSFSEIPIESCIVDRGIFQPRLITGAAEESDWEFLSFWDPQNAVPKIPTLAWQLYQPMDSHHVTW